MRINADFTQRVLLHADEIEWLDSPMPGVARRPLDRIGEEVARATTIVRFAPGSAFSAHTHGGGEEYIVLEGVFQDETGDFPAGSYVRNPPTSRHTPASAPGCTIFVKLWQMDAEDRTQVMADMNRAEPVADPARPGVAVAELFRDARETVRLETWAPEAEVAMALPGGAEVLVLEGTAEESGEALRKHSWLRVPAGGRLAARAGAEGARVWLKTGHLADLEALAGSGPAAAAL
ncbi:MAG: cupin domain-containing protein [Pseudomonadota bacterium]